MRTHGFRQSQGISIRPFGEFPAARRKAIRFVLLDIDDTLTSGGRLTAPAYGALEQLSQRGLRVIPVTGRPAGWCDLIARFWPVDAVIGDVFVRLGFQQSRRQPRQSPG